MKSTRFCRGTLRSLLFTLLLVSSAPPVVAQVWDPQMTYRDGGPGRPRGNGNPGYRRWPGGTMTIPYGLGVTDEEILAAARQGAGVLEMFGAMEARGYLRRPAADLVQKNTLTMLYVSFGFEKPGHDVTVEQPVVILAQTQSHGCEKVQIYGGLARREILASGDTVAFLVDDRPSEAMIFLHGEVISGTNVPAELRAGSGHEVTNWPDGGDWCSGADMLGLVDWEWQTWLIQNEQLMTDWSAAVAIGAMGGAASAWRTSAHPDLRMRLMTAGAGALVGGYTAHIGYWALKRATGGGPGPQDARLPREATRAGEDSWGALKAKYR
jgi:hypothetical protein